MECTPQLCDGLQTSDFQEKRIVRSDKNRGCEPHYVRRSPVSKLIQIERTKSEAKNPWLWDITSEGGSIKGGNADWVEKFVRVSPIFYNKIPHYDFVEVKSSTSTFYGQVRLIFEQSYPDKVQNTGFLLALVRVLTHFGSDTDREHEPRQWHSKENWAFSLVQMPPLTMRHTKRERRPPLCCR